MAGYHLRQSGVSDFRHIEHGGDFGGVWYWNRYPGIQCDNESYCYLPLLEETGFMPSKRFADGKEIQGYCRQVGEKSAFYDKALFHTRVTALVGMPISAAGGLRPIAATKSVPSTWSWPAA